MKAKHIILCAIGIIAMVLGWLFFSELSKHRIKAENIRFIPEIELTAIDGSVVSLSKLDGVSKTAILFFSPGCEYCRKEIEGILANKDSFSLTNWVFITLAPREDVDEFMVQYPLGSIPRANVCIAEGPDLYLAMDISSPPTLFIYGADGEILHYQRGAISINVLLDWLKD